MTCKYCKEEYCPCQNDYVELCKFAEKERD